MIWFGGHLNVHVNSKEAGSEVGVLRCYDWLFKTVHMKTPTYGENALEDRGETVVVCLLAKKHLGSPEAGSEEPFPPT